MKKIILALIISIMFFSATVNSYAKEISQAKSEDIEKLLDLTLTDAFIESYINAFMQIFSKAVSAGRTDDQKEQIAKISEAVEEVIIEEFPELKKQMVPLYDEYFTHEEIKELNKFYQRPLGQKVIKTMPALTQAGMELGQQWGASLGPKLEANMKKRGIDLTRK